MEKGVIAGIVIILIDMFNLAEQFGIYFIAKDSSIDEDQQRLFFFILFGVGGATLLRPMCLWSKLKVVFSMLIEIGELIAYLVLLPRTNSLIIVASIFFAVEIVCHLINLYATESNLKSIDPSECLRDYCCFPFRALLYGLIYSAQILFLFLDPESNFRATYYEILLILNIFFGISYIDAITEPCCGVKKQSSAIEEKIYHIWQIFTKIIYNIIAFIIMITTIVFAGQALQQNNSGTKILKQYDIGVYIYCLVIYGMMALGQMMEICALCLACVGKNGREN